MTRLEPAGVQAVERQACDEAHTAHAARIEFQMHRAEKVEGALSRTSLSVNSHFPATRSFRLMPGSSQLGAGLQQIKIRRVRKRAIPFAARALHEDACLDQ